MSSHSKQERGFRLPIGLRIDLAQRKGRPGIRWIGRNEDGVAMWEGTWRELPKWFTLLFKCLGLGLVCLAAVFAAVGLWQAVPGPAIAGTLHSFLGFYLFERLKYSFDSSMTADEAADQLGLAAEEFKQFVHQKDIRPTHIFNDQPVYNLEAFGEVGTLLRSAEQPVEPERTLLRPAGNAPSSPIDNLLRLASKAEAPYQVSPVHQPAFSPTEIEEESVEQRTI